ncbi:MAG: PrsW family intramembrane metalloprotease [Treponema sp.]|jgi:RsiW-degrading membrane proteinase PrsW (M82 family)|nr:PrsW family intramembrane metalloprotease [Treponema sp.]
MSGLWVLFLLVFISAIPAIAVYIWFRASRRPFSFILFLCALLAGAAAFFPALLFQSFFPPAGSALAAGKWGLFVQIFIRVALTEELSRFIMLLIFFGISGRLRQKESGRSVFPLSGAEETPPFSYNDVIQGAAAGLVAGLGFAILESASYGASSAGAVLLRAVTAAPLHGACGSRVGASVALFRKHFPQAVFRFLTAVVIHGIYNFMIIMPGFPSIAAVLIALSALASSILSIRSGKIRG